MYRDKFGFGKDSGDGGRAVGKGRDAAEERAKRSGSGGSHPRRKAKRLPTSLYRPAAPLYTVSYPEEKLFDLGDSLAH